ncbi:hypothetical protein AHAS_Ahas19G0226600 [Arachis hypogaea]
MYHDWCKSFSTYLKSYDLLHADYLFSILKKMCIDRILRPESMLIVRDTAEVINEIESMVKSMNWEICMTYTKKMRTF